MISNIWSENFLSWTRSTCLSSILVSSRQRLFCEDEFFSVHSQCNTFFHRNKPDLGRWVRWKYPQHEAIQVHKGVTKSTKFGILWPEYVRLPYLDKFWETNFWRLKKSQQLIHKNSPIILFIKTERHEPFPTTTTTTRKTRKWKNKSTQKWRKKTKKRFGPISHDVMLTTWVTTDS